MRRIKQTIYDHGGSRIYEENEDGSRNLLVSTYPQPYGGDRLAKAVMNFILEYNKFPEILVPETKAGEGEA
jgi:hypothetical protein